MYEKCDPVNRGLRSYTSKRHLQLWNFDHAIEHISIIFNYDQLLPGKLILASK